jgi:hypothetical protein
MFNWLQKRKYTDRLREGLCPYCEAEMQWAILFDGVKRPAWLCPNLDYGFVYLVDYESSGKEYLDNVEFVRLDWSGQRMPIPEQYIQWEGVMTTGDDDQRAQFD